MTMARTKIEPVEDDIEPAAPFLAEPFHNPMASAPRDKRWIEASVDGSEWVRVRYYHTRIRTGAIQWIPVECWTTSDPPKFAGRVDGLTMWRECSQWTP
jgi:hypothetical protein